MAEGTALAWAVAIFVGSMAVGLPIYVGILGAAIYLDTVVNRLPLAAVFSGLYESLAKTSLMAVPLFILTGSLMDASGMGERLVRFFMWPLRRVRGGLPIGCLLANEFFGAISGSAPAAVATFSKIAYRPLCQEYGERLALGLITSSGALSTIIPPSILMILYGVVTETSITTLFLGGFLPGAVIAVLVGGYLFLVAGRPLGHNPEGEGFWLKRPAGPAWSALPVLAIPVLILGGIYSGLFTPTEAGAVAAVYCAGAAVFIYRDLGLRRLLEAMVDAARTTGQVFILIASSTVLAQAVTIAQVPQFLVQSFSGFSASTFLLFVNLLLLVVGCFFDPASGILVLAPLLLPTARQLGIDPLHLGIVFTVNLSIGMFTPPFGLNLFVVQSVLRKPLEQVTAAVVPFLLLYIVALALVTYVPQLATWLPRMLGT